MWIFCGSFTEDLGSLSFQREQNTEVQVQFSNNSRIEGPINLKSVHMVLCYRV